MIDFSKVKAMTIPEGSVKEIAIDGVTVWKKYMPITITMTTNTSADTYCEVYVGETRYMEKGEDATVVVPSGTIVRCRASASNTTYGGGRIYLNDVQVTSSDKGWVEYAHVATTNLTIEVKAVSVSHAASQTRYTRYEVYITEESV